MAFPPSLVSYSVPFSSNNNRASSIRTKPITPNHVSLRPATTDGSGKPGKAHIESEEPLCPATAGFSSCCCGRRRFIESAAAVAATALLPVPSSGASERDPMDVLNRIHPPRPDWYEEFYASAMDSTMKSYEAEIAGYKAQLFGNLKGKAQRVMELGIGTGPNLRYYATADNEVTVFGVDPNRKMERYARTSAAAAGLSPRNFEFIQAVGESIPLEDASVDAVVGTLVLCSVQDVDRTLKEVKRVLKPGGLYIFVEHVAAKDGTILRFVQSVLDPLQQTVADGCHLTRETGNSISEAGFSSAELHTAFLSTASLINPHLYGIACK